MGIPTNSQGHYLGVRHASPFNEYCKAHGVAFAPDAGDDGEGGVRATASGAARQAEGVEAPEVDLRVRGSGPGSRRPRRFRRDLQQVAPRDGRATSRGASGESRQSVSVLMMVYLVGPRRRQRARRGARGTSRLLVVSCEWRRASWHSRHSNGLDEGALGGGVRPPAAARQAAAAIAMRRMASVTSPRERATPEPVRSGAGALRRPLRRRHRGRRVRRPPTPPPRAARRRRCG